VVSCDALDPRHHQRLQCLDLRHSILLWHFWLLRRLHLLAKGHPGADPPMGYCRGYGGLSRSHGGPSGPDDCLCLRCHWWKQFLSTAGKEGDWRLRHTFDDHLLHRLRTHWPYGECECTDLTDQQSFLPNPRSELVHSLLGDWRCRHLHRHPLCSLTDDSILLWPQRYALHSAPLYHQSGC